VEVLDWFGGVGYDDETVGGRGDDLLVRVSAAAALHQPAVRGDLVSAVDRDVEFVQRAERLDRQAEARCFTGRSLRCGHTAD